MAVSPPLFPTSSRPRRGNLRSRVVSVLLSAMMLALFGIMVLHMGLLGNGGQTLGSRLTAVSLSASSKATPKQAHAAAKAKSSPTQPPLPHPPTPVPPKVPPLAIIHLSHDEFAAADISKLPSHRNEDASSADSGNSASTYGPGEGPGGAHLFNAEWYREPPRAALASYLPNGAPPGSWAMIACRTVEHYHVEDCQELDESPPGTGLSRALRQAAWQFLVRPPRINGQPIIGAWVRIRFDFTRGGTKLAE